MFSTGAASVSVLLIFPFLVTILCAHFLTLFHLIYMRFPQSTPLVMHLSLGT